MRRHDRRDQSGLTATSPLRVVALIAALAAALVLTTLVAPRARAATTVRAHGSAHQVWATGLPARAKATLLHHGHRIRTKRVDKLGGLLFRHVHPGKGYRIRVAGTTSNRVRVHTNRAKPWDPGIYDQTIPAGGYGYLTTRDGTKLAYSVHLPTAPATLGVGLPTDLEQKLPNLGLPYTPPYPTVIEYAGYGYAQPKGPQSGIAVLANLMGFAVVDVNMRGTGCSGGAYDFFEPLQNLDAYDVIETVARQPWVKGHKVGMIGISYGAISQLFTAQLNPPSLAAITPLSTIDSVATTLFPGGSLNTGFALQWALERAHDALPAGPHAGQPWAWDRIQQGDRTCEANQAMHGQARDLLAKIKANRHYHPKTADPLDPISFVHKIHVPVFLACQWEDEQTGGHCPALVSHFTGTEKKWFTFTNGAHIDSLDPETFNRWFDFLEIYVAHEAPMLKSVLVRATAPLIYQQAMGLPGSDLLTLPDDPIQHKASYRAAKEAFEKLPRVRVLFDNGAGPFPPGAKHVGNPYPAYEHSFSDFPIPGRKARSWYLGAHGKLRNHPAKFRRGDRYVTRGRQAEQTDYESGGNTGAGGLWGDADQWQWQWKQRRKGQAVSYVSAPLKHDVTVIGAGAVYVWVRSSKRDADFQATVSEVRPDGKETFVQSGWMRGSERKLAKGKDNVLKQRSTLLQPVPSMRKRDVRWLPHKHFTKVAIPLYFQGHAYRKGSRLRLTISGPGGDQPIWAFAQARPRGHARVDVLHSAHRRSRLVLPVVPGLSVPTALPPCPGLRNEPCRPYHRFHNHRLTRRQVS